MNNIIKLKYGNMYVNFPLSKWKKIKIFIPEKHTKTASFKREIIKSINNPIGTKALENLLYGKQSVAIVIPDSTRVSRCDKYLPILINEIKKAKISDSNVRIIVANGTHVMKGSSVNKKIVGKDVPSTVKLIDHNCDDENSLVYIGNTSRGNDVYINKVFHESDFKIATGTIGFHYFAGFSGGGKAILPGISGRKTVEFNHKLFLAPQKGFNKSVDIGKLCGNPVYEDMLEAARLAKVDFLINFVFDEEAKLIKVFSGDVEKAHEEGAKYAGKRFRIKTKKKADIVVVSCGGYPKDINFVQAHKAMQNASYCLKKGGTMIFLAECSDGLGSNTIYEWFQLKNIDELEKKLRNSYRINGHTALSMWLKAEKFKIIFVTNMQKEIVQKMGAIPAGSLEEAIDIAKIKESDKIYIIPEGSATLVTMI